MGGAGVLVAYYGIALGSVSGRDSGAVRLEGAPSGSGQPSDERLTVQVEAEDLDTATGSLDLSLQPVAQGTFIGERGGQLPAALHVELSSPGDAPVAFDFPADQIVDPVTASLDASTGAHKFPFDRPEASFRLEVISRDRPVPIDLEIANETEGWRLFGSQRADGDALVVDLEARREVLAITFAVFYITGIVVVALITVAIIGRAIAHRQVNFDQVIWLVAMLVIIPAVRNEMPGVPPVGTAVDLLVFLPSIFVVGVALVAAIVVLAIDDPAVA